MGAMLGCLAADLSCCLGQAACRLLCGIFGAVSSSSATRLAYAFLFLVNSLISWLMLSDWAVKELTKRFNRLPFYRIDCPEGLCYGTLAVYRMTFALCLFHIILALMTIGVRTSGDLRASFQNGFWGPKLIVLVLFTVMAFYLPNGFIEAYGSVSRFASGLFIIIQQILLIDFAYKWSEKCLQRYEDTDDKRWIVLLSSSTILLYISIITVTGLMYPWFGSDGRQCSLNQFFITFNLVLTVAVALAAIHPRVQETNSQSGLPQASVVAAYNLYLIFSAMANEPRSDVCNAFHGAQQPRTVNILIGAVLTFVAIVYSTSSAASQGHTMMMVSNSASPGRSTNDDRDDVPLISRGGAAVDSEDFQDEEDAVRYNYSFFHLVYAVGCMYVAMLLTNWDTLQQQQAGGESVVVIGQSWQAVWVKIVTSWLTYLMYVWTLVAPLVLPDRDWS